MIADTARAGCTAAGKSGAEPIACRDLRRRASARSTARGHCHNTLTSNILRDMTFVLSHPPIVGLGDDLEVLPGRQGAPVRPPNRRRVPSNPTLPVLLGTICPPFP